MALRGVRGSRICVAAHAQPLGPSIPDLLQYGPRLGSMAGLFRETALRSRISRSCASAFIASPLTNNASSVALCGAGRCTLADRMRPVRRSAKRLLQYAAASDKLPRHPASRPGRDKNPPPVRNRVSCRATASFGGAGGVKRCPGQIQLEFGRGRGGALYPAVPARSIQPGFQQCPSRIGQNGRGGFRSANLRAVSVAWRDSPSSSSNWR